MLIMCIGSRIRWVLIRCGVILCIGVSVLLMFCFCWICWVIIFVL